jgi:hypothetical protein
MEAGWRGLRLVQARIYLITAIIGAALVILFAPPLIEYYPYDVTLKRTYVASSNALWGGSLNNSLISLPPFTYIALPSDQGDFLQPAGKRDYALTGSVYSNVSLTFAILDNSSYVAFKGNSSAFTSLLRRDVASGETAQFSLPLTNNGIYYYLFLSKEPSAGALVKFNLNETWTYEVLEPEVQFSIMKGILPPLAVIVGASLLVVSLLKLRKIASEAPEAQTSTPPVETQV